MSKDTFERGSLAAFVMVSSLSATTELSSGTNVWKVNASRR